MCNSTIGFGSIISKQNKAVHCSQNSYYDNQGDFMVTRDLGILSERLIKITYSVLGRKVIGMIIIAFDLINLYEDSCT